MKALSSLFMALFVNVYISLNLGKFLHKQQVV